jgi:hypothetical protein
MTTFYVRPTTGNDAADGLTPATAWLSLTLGALASRIAPGDAIRVEETGGPTAIGNATWTNGASAVTLAATPNVDLYDCDSGFTSGQAGVTCTQDVVGRKQGSASSVFTVAPAVAGGKLGYRTLAAPVNASSCRQVCFWLRSSVVLPAGRLRLDLCTDALGDVPALSVVVAYPVVNNWMPIVVDAGVALPAAINSIALTALGSLAVSSVDVRVDNIFAAKAPGAADEITLLTLISKNAAGEAWFPVRSLFGTSLALDGDVNSTADGAYPAYTGATAAVATFVKQCRALPPSLVRTSGGASGPLDTPWGLINDSGTGVLPITVSGGWDSATMAAQTSETNLSLVTGIGTGVTFNGKDYIDVSKIGFANTGVGFRMTGRFNSYSDAGIARLRQGEVAASFADNPAARTCRLRSIQLVGGNNTVALLINFNDPVLENVLIASVRNTISAAISAAVIVNGSSTRPVFNNLFVYDCIRAMVTEAPVLVRGGAFRQLVASEDVLANGAIPDAEYVFTDVVFFNANPINPSSVAQSGLDTRIRLHNKNQVANDHYVFVQDGQILPDLLFFRTGNKSWVISPSGPTRTTQYPIIFPLGPLWRAVGAGTVTVYVYRDNANIKARLRIPAGQYCTPTVDLVAEDLGAVGAWNAITIPITMSQADSIDAQLEVYTTDGLGGYNCWTDDLS